MKLPVYELKISENLNDDSEVSYVALVDSPAIQKDFLAFKEEFINPSKGEHKDEFLPRCIKYVIDEGKSSEQAVAICNSIWTEHFAEGYTDYPKEATENAKIALRWAEQNGWGDCGTQVGKIRANQLANREPISRDTIARMSAFERHRQNSDKQLGDGCGRLMWLAWGGDAGIEWASRKLEQIDSFAGTKVSIDYDDTLSTERGKTLAKRLISNGDVVYIISARQDKEGMLSVAKELGIPENRVYATGSNKAKIEKIKELGIAKHHDNNPDVIKELGSIGVKFYQAFQIVSEDEHIISGPLMVADMPIYRNNEKFGEHYVTFSAETIRQIAIKFAKKKYQNHVNLMHDPNMTIDGCTMFESFIVDKKRGIMPMQGFEDIADGSWFGSFYVENPEVWKNIKDGFLKGFSVEGMFDYDEPTKTLSAEEQALKKISELLNSITDESFGGPGSGRHPEGGNNDSEGGGKINYNDPKELQKNTDRLINENIDTEKLFKNSKGEYNKERSKFHEDLINDYMKDGSTDLGTSYFMGGAPATGKSSILDDGQLVLPKGILVVDSDAIKSKIPEYNEMVKSKYSESASKVHEESSTLSKSIVSNAVKNKMDIVNDGVGDGSYDSVAKKVEEQRKAGKKVEAHYVTTDTNVSLERAKKRGERTGRIVPERYIKNMHKEISTLFPQFEKNKLFDTLKLYDNNGSKPKLIFQQKNGVTTIYDKNAYNKFLAKSKE